MSRQMNPQSTEEVHDAVRSRYAAAAQAADPARECCCGGSGCCADSPASAGTDPITSNLYEIDDADSQLAGALAASLGCGNPTALAELHPGEDVLDLGSGGGIDVLLSARRVAPGGTAYGLDMTEEMLELARRNRAEAGVENVQFLKGRIEEVPLPDDSVDVVISNCVINLSPDKDAVLAEAFRVLRPGGRFAVSDIVLLRDISDELRGVVALWTGCISGALRDTEYVEKLTDAGFTDAAVQVTRTYTRDDLLEMAGMIDLAELPEGTDVATLVDALEGAFASAFVRAARSTS